MENWKDIPGYENLYQISDLGNVRSLDRITKGFRGCDRLVKGRILSKCLNKKGGYYKVTLCRYGISDYHFAVHRLVALLFIKNSDLSKTQVNHINGIKTDNRVENLEWVDNRENCSHRSNTALNTTGAYYFKAKDKWQSKIYVDGKSKSLGYFNTQIEAAQAYVNYLSTHNLNNKYA